MYMENANEKILIAYMHSIGLKLLSQMGMNSFIYYKCLSHLFRVTSLKDPHSVKTIKQNKQTKNPSTTKENILRMELKISK